MALCQPIANGQNRIRVGLNRECPSHQINTAPDEVLSLVRMVSELRLAEIGDTLPPVRPGSIRVFSVKTVDIEVFDTVCSLCTVPAVRVMQCPALAECNEQQTVAVYSEVRITLEEALSVRVCNPC